MTQIIRRIALTLNVFLFAFVIWGAILVPWHHQPWQSVVHSVIRFVAAGTAVIAIWWPNGWTRR